MEDTHNALEDVVILYCEDEVELRDITSSVLKKFVKKVYLVDNGEEGLETFKKYSEEIDLIITDVNVPKINGLDMAKEIKKINQNIPIIITTAFSNSEYLLEAINIGVDKYVLKPMNIKKLLQTIKSSLLYHELQDLYKDSLTHLYSRNRLVKDEKELENPIVALFDIDDFADINELYGDENGDKLLVKFAHRLKTFFNDDFRHYRINGDRFIILSTKYDIKSLKEKVKVFVKKIEDDGIRVDENTTIYLNVTTIFAYSQNKKVFTNALKALDFAKKNFIQFLVFDPSIHIKNINYDENIAWIKRLKKGLFKGNFKAYFQPIIDVKTKKAVKYEALIRYIEDDGSTVPPGIFLPIAKKAKLFSGIIKLMINESINFIKVINKQVSVNLSFEDMNNPDTLEYITNKIKENKDVANKLHFELLETEEIQNFELVKNFIDNIHKFGCKVGMDDFGSGYSNFNILEELDVDFIKIDGSLIKNIDINETQGLIVETIVSFAKKIDVSTVAEFVSSDSIYDTIKSIGIDMAQGYHFGKPMSLEEVIEFEKEFK